MRFIFGLALGVPASLHSSIAMVVVMVIPELGLRSLASSASWATYSSTNSDWVPFPTSLAQVICRVTPLFVRIPIAPLIVTGQLPRVSKKWLCN